MGLPVAVAAWPSVSVVAAAFESAAAAVAAATSPFPACSQVPGGFEEEPFDCTLSFGCSCQFDSACYLDSAFQLHPLN